MTSEDAVAARADKACGDLAAAAALFRAGLAEQAVGPMYFAGFHLVQALLATAGINAETHRGTQQMFSFHFVRGGALPSDAGRRLSQLMNDRGLADYGLGADVTAASARETRANLLALLPPIIALLRERAPESAQALARVESAAQALSIA